MKVRELLQSDIERICSIHTSTFDAEHFSTLFSSEMLYEYYRILIKNNKISICAIDDNNHLLGYLISADGYNKTRKEFIRKFRMGLLRLLFANPRFLKEKLYDYFYEKMKLSSSGVFVIYILAVDNSKKEKGIGQFILDSFEQLLREMNILEYGLYVRKNNIRAMKFYDKNRIIRKGENYNFYFYYKSLTQE